MAVTGFRHHEAGSCGQDFSCGGKVSPQMECLFDCRAMQWDKTRLGRPQLLSALFEP